MILFALKSTILLAILFTFQFAHAQETSTAELIDSFSYSNSEIASASIDNFRVQLQNTPNQTGYIIIYGGKIIKKGEVEAHIRGIKQTFKQKGIDVKTIPIKVGGYREKLTVEFWGIPQGAKMPQPTPTVKANKVKIKGVSKKIIPYDCCF